MNENDPKVIEPNDDEVLLGVRKRLSAVEALLPMPPAWRASGGVEAGPVRPSVRTPVRLGGLLSLGVVGAVLVVTVGMALSIRNGSGGVATPTPDAQASGVAPIAAPAATTAANVPSAGRTLGGSSAPVTLDVWVDFRCTACAVFNVGTLPQLIAEYVAPGKLKIVEHDLIIVDSYVVGSTESRDAAAAARCAADQGKFWLYQDWLYANQSPDESAGAFTQARLAEIARGAGLDMTAFQPCLAGGRHTAEVTAESEAAAAFAQGTPWFLIDGAAGGTATYADLAPIIDAALAKAGAAGGSPAIPSPGPSSTAGSSPSAAASSAPSPDAKATLMTYVVRNGDTITAIAAKFGIRIADLEAVNPQIADFNHITVGMSINIPWPGWAPTAPPPTPAAAS